MFNLFLITLKTAMPDPKSLLENIENQLMTDEQRQACLLYTSDAADE